MRLFAFIAASLLFATPVFAQEGEGETESTSQESEKPSAEKAADKPSATKAVPEDAAAEESVAAESGSEDAAAEPGSEEAAAESDAVRDSRVLSGRAIGHVADGITAEPMAKETRREGDDCVFDDLKGEFTITLPCDMLADHTGHSSPLKRFWLAAPNGQLNMIEVPDPYRTVPIAEIMADLGRYWTPFDTPQPITETTLGGVEALVVTERKIRTLTRHWVLNLNGRNVTVKLAAYDLKHADRVAWLDKVSAAFEAGIKLN